MLALEVLSALKPQLATARDALKIQAKRPEDQKRESYSVVNIDLLMDVQARHGRSCELHERVAAFLPLQFPGIISGLHKDPAGK
jgi:hypothetical protein